MELRTLTCLGGGSKKQKVQGADADQSIDQLNDVTAVSGVNLRVSPLIVPLILS